RGGFAADELTEEVLGPFPLALRRDTEVSFVLEPRLLEKTVADAPLVIDAVFALRPRQGAVDGERNVVLLGKPEDELFFDVAEGGTAVIDEGGGDLEPHLFAETGEGVKQNM